ncbi:MAG: HAMP domain-containing protein [Gammaproteobacteria bacterium]|nr:MAG: HAMP domain-containing protein [Gammaproteobacteria bacterium]
MKLGSLRWRLIGVSGSLALIAALAVVAMLERRVSEQSLAEIAETLEEEGDEVVAFLEDPDLAPAVDDFLRIETSHRFKPRLYFYKIRGIDGRTRAQSAGAQSVTLPLPTRWNLSTRGQVVSLETVSNAGVDEPLLVRSERVEVKVRDRERETLIIQIAVSLGSWRTEVRKQFITDALTSAAILAAMFLLIWFVTAMSLRPVAAITRQAAHIGARNLDDRIPIAGAADELDELAKVLNAMLDRLADSMRRTAEFSADVAHQLRPPLTRVRARLDLLLRGEIPASLRGEIEALGEEVVRLSRLCGHLLLLGRLELPGGEAHLLGERIDLKEVAEELVEQCSPMAHERGLALKIGAPVPAHVRGNRVLLVEALLNLIDNAVRWTPSGGTIRVSVDSNGREAVLSVADSGPGIPEAERERIFQPFYRMGETAVTHTSAGSGLGLAIVRAIARTHGGRVELLSSAGPGAEFRVVFPAFPAD